MQGMKNFSKTLNWFLWILWLLWFVLKITLSRYHRSGRLSSLIEHIVSFNSHIIFIDNIRAIALSLGIVFLSIEHFALVTLGHCPNLRSVLFSIEHFVPLDVMYTNCNSIEYIVRIGIHLLLYLVFIQCGAVSRVLSQGRDQTLSLRITVLR